MNITRIDEYFSATHAAIHFMVYIHQEQQFIRNKQVESSIFVHSHYCEANKSWDFLPFFASGISQTSNCSHQNNKFKKINLYRAFLSLKIEFFFDLLNGTCG